MNEFTVTYKFQNLKQSIPTANIGNSKMRPNGFSKNLIDNLPHSNLSITITKKTQDQALLKKTQILKL